MYFPVIYFWQKLLLCILTHSFTIVCYLHERVASAYSTTGGMSNAIGSLVLQSTRHLHPHKTAVGLMLLGRASCKQSFTVIRTCSDVIVKGLKSRVPRVGKLMFPSLCDNRAKSDRRRCSFTRFPDRVCCQGAPFAISQTLTMR